MIYIYINKLIHFKITINLFKILILDWSHYANSPPMDTQNAQGLLENGPNEVHIWNARSE